MKSATDKLIAATNRFGFKLFAELLKQQPNQNIFISPLSISIALSMLYNGAVGQTQAEMAIALGIQNMSVQEVNQANAQLIKLLENLADVQVAIANSLWAKPNLQFRANFLQQVQEFYQAEVRNLDFGASDATTTINRWVAKKTQSKIQQIVRTLDPATILALLNAIYFKGNWAEPFDPNATQEQGFTLLDGSQKQVAMMSQSNEYCYYLDKNFQAVRLPYRNGQLSMYIFLPLEDYGLEAFLKSLNPNDWDKWMAQFPQEVHQGTLVFPRFQLEYEVNEQLKDVLITSGLKRVFGIAGAPDFQQISDDPLQLSQVTHKTCFEVKEEGTEAVAATVVFAVRGGMSLQYFTMIVDRPFFCAIRDQQTGAILFMGIVVDPVAAE